MINILTKASVPGVPDILENLLPNLPNFIAHILSTIVILFFLTKMVYKPFKETVEKRRNKINELLDDASEKKSLANKDRKEAKLLLDNAKGQSQVILNEARSEADKTKFLILAKAKEEASNLHLHAKSAIDNERSEAQQEIRQNIIELAFAAANKVLEAEISKEKNDKLIKEFIDNLDK